MKCAFYARFCKFLMNAWWWRSALRIYSYIGTAHVMHVYVCVCPFDSFRSRTTKVAMEKLVGVFETIEWSPTLSYHYIDRLYLSYWHLQKQWTVQVRLAHLWDEGGLRTSFWLKVEQQVGFTTKYCYALNFHIFGQCVGLEWKKSMSALDSMTKKALFKLILYRCRLINPQKVEGAAYKLNEY